MLQESFTHFENLEGFVGGQALAEQPYSFIIHTVNAEVQQRKCVIFLQHFSQQLYHRTAKSTVRQLELLQCRVYLRKEKGERRSATRVNKTELCARVFHFSHL